MACFRENFVTFCFVGIDSIVSSGVSMGEK